MDGGSPGTAPSARSPHAHPPATRMLGLLAKASAVLVQQPLSSPDSNTRAAGHRVQNHHERLVHNPTCLSTHSSPFLERVSAKIYEAALTAI